MICWSSFHWMKEQMLITVLIRYRMYQYRTPHRITFVPSHSFVHWHSSPAEWLQYSFEDLLIERSIESMRRTLFALFYCLRKRLIKQVTTCYVKYSKLMISISQNLAASAGDWVDRKKQSWPYLKMEYCDWLFCQDWILVAQSILGLRTHDSGIPTTNDWSFEIVS